MSTACASFIWLLDRFVIEAKSSLLSIVTNTNVTFDNNFLVSVPVLKGTVRVTHAPYICESKL